MGQRRRVRRRGAAGVVPIVVLGAAVSLGVVAVTASRFGWRRTKADKVAEKPESETTGDPQPKPDETRPSRFKPAPPRDPDAPRWDTPPPVLTPPQPDASPP
jgi:hypothetical protein